MMFAFSATAYAATFTDLEDKSVTVQDAVAKTVALGIIDGYTDGTFGADKNITRAEFAKIAVTAAGSAETATMLEKTASSFKDVKAGAWYTGWVNAAESLGLVQGVGNGNYNPNSTITNQEVVTVLMRMLGYNDNLPGNWPVNYVTQANKTDVLDNVAIVAAAPATRGDVVVMLSDALDTNMVTYDKDTNEFVNKQIGVSQSVMRDYTLLEDSFDGMYEEVGKFAAVEDVRDAAKKQLTWQSSDANDANTYIIDENTRVSVNGGNLFELAGHQGKVYFVEDNDKLYARFIEVESYATAVGGSKPAVNNKGKLEANNKTYTTAANVDITSTAGKNNKWKLFFNDDDQVYAVASDQDDTRKAYFVESVGKTIKLAGNGGETTGMDDEDTLIWNGEEFVSPSTLEVGDALIQVTEDELYILTEAKTGVVKSTTDTKVNIGGTNYVGPTVECLDAEYEDAGVTWDEVYNNEVTYLLNKDNTLSAVIVGEVSTGTKLYGVIVGGDEADTNRWGSAGERKVSIFTEEGAVVEYDVDEDKVDVTTLNVNLVGELVEYKLNKDGEIKDLKTNATAMPAGEIEVKNNAYLVDVNGKAVTLASNVAVFEISDDSGDIDVNLVTRAALLGGGDFTPGPVDLTEVVVDEQNDTTLYLSPTCDYFKNTNGAVRAMAYTDANTTKYHYGVVSAMNLDLDGDTDVNGAAIYNDMYLVGDDTAYEFTVDANCVPTTTVDDDYAIIYQISGGDINIVASLNNEPGKKVYTDEVLTGTANDEDKYYVSVKSVNDGIIITNSDVWVTFDLGNQDASGFMNNIMTDSETIVAVITKTGEVVEGTLDDISKNAYVNVPVVDKDGYADIVVVNEYTDYQGLKDAGLR